MDGEGEEWSQLAGSGVVVDVVRWFCFGWEKKKEERASDERERGRGNEIELVIFILIKGIIVISSV
ncbi:hypothetical protein MtrunA17_Chr3g0088771 [Medicago truncatula]|uniref:Uncharacterized protein n=1 Tax=Medicago truncatula TaxID=3880 RepID=A0A396IPH1_MEDTR|nr:hypothetical protein MtrunA17_Chr3g0088771 [Medicago truncatula]